MIIVRLLSPGPFGWLAPPKFTRVQGADIVMESITLIDPVAGGFERYRLISTVDAANVRDSRCKQKTIRASRQSKGLNRGRRVWFKRFLDAHCWCPLCNQT